MACISHVTDMAVVFRGYLAGFFCIFAIVGNLLCAIVLSSQKMRASPVNRILLALSLADLTFCTTNLFDTVTNVLYNYYCPDIRVFYWIIYPLTQPYIFPIRIASQVASIYLTVLVSCERYLAICRPFLAITWCTPKRSTVCSILVTIFAILYTLPVWWEKRSVPYTAKLRDSHGNLTRFKGYVAIDTFLARNADYELYYIKWGTFFVFRLIPFISLLIFNVFIFKAVYEMNKQRETMTLSQTQEVSISKMLLSVIMVFLLCNGVKIYVYMADLVASETFIELLSDLLVLSNPTFNFLIYCFFSKQFRTQFQRIILWRCYTRPEHRFGNSRSTFQRTTVSSVL